MSLRGRFIVNNADFSPLIIYGIGTFIAFSGNKIYRDRGGCVAIPNNSSLHKAVIVAVIADSLIMKLCET